MTNSTMEDYYRIVQDQVLLVLAGILALAGLLIQLFIVSVNVNDWMKGRPITEADKIIISIAISRILFDSTFMLTRIPPTSFTDFLNIFNRLNRLIGIISDFSSIWLSTLLSTFFYLKISTSHYVFFLRLKTIISRKVVYLIVASVLVSVIYTSLNGFVFPGIPLFTNSTQDDTSYHQQRQIWTYVRILFSTLPLLIYFIASLLLVVLLGLHLSKMNNGGNVTIDTDTYLRIMKFTIVSFLTCALYIILGLYLSYNHDVYRFWLYVIRNIFPVLHSLLLIYVATKLRNQFSRIVHCGAGCLFNREAAGPHSREATEVTSF